MKILWIISSGWKEGGAESYVALLRPVLEAKGHTVRIFASDDRQDMPHFNDYSFHAYTGIFRWLFHTWNPSAYFALKRVLREFKPDLVHIHTVGFASPAVLFPLKGHPTILTMHGPEGFMKSLRLFCFPRSYFRGGVYKEENLLFMGKVRRLYHQLVTDPLFEAGFRNIRAIIAPSTYIQKLVKEDGHESTYLPNGTQLFDAVPLPEGEGREAILFAGRLESYKGVDYLLRAFTLLSGRFPKAKLIIVGDGGERDRLEHLAGELGIADRTEFLGRLNRNALEKIYERASVAVMPSVGVEAFGLSGVEAMSAGRPVVAFRVGGIPDWLVDGETGFLVPPGETKALADSIGKLIEDDALLKEMSQKARVRAEEFGIESHANALFDFYTETLRSETKST